jgi:hypothetical protein
MSWWEKHLVTITILICIVLVGVFAEGVGEGRRREALCTNPRASFHYLGRPGVNPYTVYECDEGLRAYYDDGHKVLSESRVELK